MLRVKFVQCRLVRLTCKVKKNEFRVSNEHTASFTYLFFKLCVLPGFYISGVVKKKFFDLNLLFTDLQLTL